MVGDSSLLLMGALFGLSYGVLLQKGDFCFVSSFRDWFAFKHNRVLQGVILAVLVALTGWSLSLAAGWAPMERLWLPPVGFSALIGGVVFGVGMYVAGACASGTLYRCGMGYAYFWLVFLGMKIGYLVYAYLHEPFFLPYYFEQLSISGPITLYSYIPPWAVFFAALVLLIYIARKWTAQSGGEEASAARGAKQRQLSEKKTGNPLRLRSWDSRLVGALVGVLVALQFMLWSIWGITGPGTRIAGVIWGGIFGESIVRDNMYLGSMFADYPAVLFGPAEILIFFIIIGATISSMLGRTFRYRKPRLNRLPNAIGGGMLMGIGSRMAPGCNIGNIISGLPALSVHSMIASFGIALGIYMAYLVAQRNIQRQMKAMEQKRKG